MSNQIFRQSKHQIIMGLRYSSKKSLLWVVVFGCSIYAFALYMRRPCPNVGYDNQPLLQHMVLNGKDQIYHYDKNSPFIFIGGMPRSGTTLARVLLDAHPDIRCGEETRVVPRLLQMRAQWYKSPKETVRLEEAGVFPEVLNNAVGAFIVEVMARHGEPAARLCNKDPFTMKSAVYLSQLFPNAKFILMVRDGRATVHSIISRKVTITGFDLTNYRSCMQRWNQAIQTMYNECKSVGSSRCMMVYYEQLVLHPKQWLEKIMSFLQVPWDDVLLHHEELINKPGGISLSKVERSSDQVVKPINIEALSKWVGAIPEDVVRDMADLAPMLAKLGYDPKANPPNYGDPDAFVSKNTFDVIQNQSRWQNKTLHLLKPKKEMLSGEDDKVKEGFNAGEEKSVDKGEP